MTPETFTNRIKYITKSNYSILGLDECVRLLKDKNNRLRLPVVITIDDGWSSILRFAHPILRVADARYTIYLTSWYCKNNNPIFNLAVPFVLWKAKDNGIDLKKINLPVQINDDDLHNCDNLSKKIINYGLKLSINDRYTMLKDICDQVMFDYKSLYEEKWFSLLDSYELSVLIRDGVDIQFHTHTHTWPMDENQADLEILKNKLFIENFTKNIPDHFCYPHGIWDKSQFKYLIKNKIKSATTCDTGLNGYDTNVYALRRFLDSEDKPQIVFEAELSGFISILDKIGIFNIKKLL